MKKAKKKGPSLAVEVRAEIDALWDAVEKLEADERTAQLDAAANLDPFLAGLHSCHPDCKQPVCMMRRERDAALSQRDAARGMHRLAVQERDAAVTLAEDVCAKARETERRLTEERDTAVKRAEGAEVARDEWRDGWIKLDAKVSAADDLIATLRNLLKGWGAA